MGIPQRRVEKHTTANGTNALSLAQSTSDIAVGDLVLIWVSNEEATPNISLTNSGSGTVTASISFGTNVLTGGASGNSKVRSADTTNNLYNHVWAIRITGLSGATPAMTITMDSSAGSYSTGPRRFGAIVINPNGHLWDSNSETPVRSANGNHAASVDPSYTWSGSHNAYAAVGIIAIHPAAAKTYSVNWDNDTGTTASSNSSGSTGDGGSTVFLGGTGSGTNQSACIGDAYWDDGGIPGGNDSQVTTTGSTVSGAKSGLIGLFAVKPPNTFTLPVATETGTAQAFGKKKSLAVPATAETDIAISIGLGGEDKFITLPINTETDTAQTFVRRKSHVLPVATEADTTGVVKHVHIVPKAQETDAAVDFVAYKYWHTTEVFSDKSIFDVVTGCSALVSKTDAADSGEIQMTLIKNGVPLQSTAWTALTTTPTTLTLTLSSPVTGYQNISIYFEIRTTLAVDPHISLATVLYSLGLPPATETDTPGSFGKTKRRALPVATEADAAQTIRPVKQRTLSTTTETDTPATFGRRKTWAVAGTGESDAAQVFTRKKSRTIVATTETDAASTFGRKKTRLLPVATETDTPGTITVYGNRKTIAAATETDTASTIVARKTRALPSATETDAAQALGKQKTRSLPTGPETDAAITITRGAKTKALPTATETDVAQIIIHQSNNQEITLPVATETDVAQAFGKLKRRALPTPTESDTAVGVGKKKRAALVAASETDTAVTITVKFHKVASVATAFETDIALTIQPLGGSTLGKTEGLKIGAPAQRGWTIGKPRVTELGFGSPIVRKI